MDSFVSEKDEIWFLRVCHHISNAVYLLKFVEGVIIVTCTLCYWQCIVLCSYWTCGSMWIRAVSRLQRSVHVLLLISHLQHCQRHGSTSLTDLTFLDMTLCWCVRGLWHFERSYCFHIKSHSPRLWRWKTSQSFLGENPFVISMTNIYIYLLLQSALQPLVGFQPAQLSLSILSRKVLQSAVASGTSNPQLGGEIYIYKFIGSSWLRKETDGGHFWTLFDQSHQC
jgi:hypothetical protein